MRNINFTAVAMTILLTAIPLAVLAKLYLISQEGALSHTDIIISFTVLSVLRVITSFRAFKRGVCVGISRTRVEQLRSALVKEIMQRVDKEKAKEQE